MKLKNVNSLQIRNQSDVVDERGTVVGEVHIRRRSGWRGGNHFVFFANEHGRELGLVSWSSNRLGRTFAGATANIKTQGA